MNNNKKTMERIGKDLLFFCKFMFIVICELFIYAIYRDFSSFVDRLSHRLASINILYVKLFQAFALNNSLIDESLNNKLLKFTDNAPWTEEDINYEELEIIKRDYNLILRGGCEKPINSGMISLVFKGQDQFNGTYMIIKMKRKNIDAKLADAIQNLETFLNFLSFIPLFKKYQISEVITKNIDIIRHQTNFMEEVDNMERMYNNCKNLKYVKIPLPVREVTEQYPNIIVMDFIEGIKINEIKEEDMEPFAKQVIKFGFVTTIVQGFTHGDLHAGNILFIKDEKGGKYKHKIGVIDFGIMYDLNSEFKGYMFDIISQLFETDPRETAIKTLNSGIVEPHGILQKIPKEHYENIVQFATEMVSENINVSKKANQIQIYKFMSKLKEYLSHSELADIGIRPSDNLVKSQLVLAMAHGVTFTLCKDEYAALSDKVINELFHTELLLDK